MARKGSDGRIHARLSASESYRWINCPGSVREIEALPEELKRKSSRAADEGTAAHALAEMCLMKGITPHSMLDENVMGFNVDDDMADAVQVYLDEIESIKAEFPDADFSVEKKFNLKWIHPDCFGTNDFCAATIFGTLVVMDYKHGKGVPVDVEENTQLMYYALGAAKEEEFNFDEVRLIICQPRCAMGGEKVRRWNLTASELEDWGLNILKPAAYATEDPDAPLVPGDWCDKNFCPKRSTCPALIAANQEQAVMDFADEPYDLPGPYDNYAGSMSEEEYGNLLSRLKHWAPRMKSFWTQVEKDAYKAAEQGIHIPDFKVVEKESDRSWKLDEKKLVLTLKKKAGLTVDQMYADPPPPKLKSPAQMEKISKAAKAAIKDLTKRETTGRVLVPESDKRPAVGASLFSEFEDVDEETID